VIAKTIWGNPLVVHRGLGDADPSNVSSLVHGAEMRVAETRAVNLGLLTVQLLVSVRLPGAITPARRRIPSWSLPRVWDTWLEKSSSAVHFHLATAGDRRTFRMPDQRGTSMQPTFTACREHEVRSARTTTAA
jgi:hypothetical protein